MLLCLTVGCILNGDESLHWKGWWETHCGKPCLQIQGVLIFILKGRQVITICDMTRGDMIRLMLNKDASSNIAKQGQDEMKLEIGRSSNGWGIMWLSAIAIESILLFFVDMSTQGSLRLHFLCIFCTYQHKVQKSMVSFISVSVLSIRTEDCTVSLHNFLRTPIFSHVHAHRHSSHSFS